MGLREDIIFFNMEAMLLSVDELLDLFSISSEGSRAHL